MSRHPQAPPACSPGASRRWAPCLWPWPTVAPSGAQWRSACEGAARSGTPARRPRTAEKAARLLPARPCCVDAPVPPSSRQRTWRSRSGKTRKYNSKNPLSREPAFKISCPNAADGPRPRTRVQVRVQVRVRARVHGVGGVPRVQEGAGFLFSQVASDERNENMFPLRPKK